jgi:antitoxin (DNA-binding transcriptional repressor) of toxin-antitoxin stability system
MRSVNCMHLRNNLSEFLKMARFASEQIEVRRRGRLIGAIVPPEDWQYLRLHKVVDAQTRARRASNDLQALGLDPPVELDRIARGISPGANAPGAPEGPDPWDALL